MFTFKSKFRTTVFRMGGGDCVRSEPRSFGENPDKGDERSQNDDGLKANRAHDPLEDIGLCFGDLGFELGLKSRQVGLRGKIALRRFPQRFGERLRLLGREMAFVAQRGGKAKSVEKKGAHRRNMESEGPKVHQCHAAAFPPRPAAGHGIFNMSDERVSISRFSVGGSLCGQLSGQDFPPGLDFLPPRRADVRLPVLFGQKAPRKTRPPA